MKEFDHDIWTEKEIEEHLSAFNVLVLFKKHNHSKTAEILIYGKMTSIQKLTLLERITNVFGGANITHNVCNKINEFSEKWYNKHILKRRARVINKGKK